MNRRKTQMELNRDELIDRLGKMKEQFAQKLDRTAKRNLRLEKKLAEKENELASLLAAMKKIEKTRKEQLSSKRTGRNKYTSSNRSARNDYPSIKRSSKKNYLSSNPSGRNNYPGSRRSARNNYSGSSRYDVKIVKNLFSPPRSQALKEVTPKSTNH